MSMTTQAGIAEMLDRLMVVTEMLEAAGSLIPSSDARTPGPARLSVEATEIIIARELIEMAAGILRDRSRWVLADALHETTDPRNYAASLTARFVTYMAQPSAYMEQPSAIASAVPEPDPPKSEDPAP